MMMMISQFFTVRMYLWFKYYVLLIAIALCSINELIAQASYSHNVCLTIPEIALLDIEPNTSSITLSISPALEAGNTAVISMIDDSKWINYSSAINLGGSSRRIIAQLTDTPPPGISLMLQASNYSGIGNGTHGTSTGNITLSLLPQTIIQNIGRGYTGNGANNGHQLNFSLSVTDYHLLSSSNSKTVTVLYTIID